jgi:hypothetical protein
MPSMFSISAPANLFQIWFVVYIYLLPFLLYAAWASLAMMDLDELGESPARLGWAAFVILVPLLGGGWYLLGRAQSLKHSARIAIVVTGLVVWLLPLAVGVWLAGGPLGPKALT